MRAAAAAAAVAACLGMLPAAQAAVVLANSSSGDSYSNGTGANQGQAVGATGWYYNNARSGGTVGINSTYARSGNASVNLTGPANAKADIEYLSGAVNVGGNYYATTSLGTLASLSEMHYEWYRSAASAADSHLHPSLRIYLDRDGNLNTITDRGYLIYELVYNGGAVGTPVTTEAWVGQTIGARTNLWSSNGFGFNGTDPDGGYPYDSDLSEWQAALPNAVVMGFSSGFGSGWGAFNGAVDNIGWTFNGVTTNFNFEAAAAAAVPEPASLALAGLALVGVAASRRRR